MLNWACQYSLYKIQEGFYGLLKNFPNRHVAQLIKLVIFPLGKSFILPDDKLDHKVADILLSPSMSRDRLTEGIHIPDTINESLGLIEDSLIKAIAAERVEKKIREAIRSGVMKKGAKEKELKEALSNGVINDDEATTVRTAIAAMEEVIHVDDFSIDTQHKEKKSLLKAF